MRSLLTKGLCLHVLCGLTTGLLAGCGLNSHYADFTEMTTVVGRAPRAPSDVQVLLKPNEPGCAHRVVGIYQSGRKMTVTYNGKATPEIAPMREDAARRGLDGVKEVECDNGTGNCSGKAYVCDT